MAPPGAPGQEPINPLRLPTPSRPMSRSSTGRRAAFERRERPRIERASKETSYPIMMTRTTTASVAGRSVAMRRMRRRASTATRPYCSTNGCTSFLVVDPDTNVATCPVCGFTRHMH
jgi:hypothetical protein